MTYAIDTTKRKFHRLLDSLTNISSTSLPITRSNNNASTTTLSRTVESPPKKPRIAHPISAYIRPSSRPNTDNATTSSLTGKKSTPVKAMEDRRLPNFAPLDRGQFLSRLKTFRHVDKWASKPAEVNEVQWAKRGWSCVGKERVACVGGCGQELVVMLERADQDPREELEIEVDDDDWNASVSEQLVERYADMIVTEHDEYCLWRKRGCDATIYRLPFSDPTKALSALRQRYASLSVMAGELPSTLSTPSTMHTSSLIQELGTDFFRDTQSESGVSSGDSVPPPPINEQALALAFLGWQAESGHISGLAICEACFRRLGLWLFKRKTTDPEAPETAADEEEASMSRLDILGEHRDYCPWINPLSQSGGGTPKKGSSGLSELAGWEILARIVRNTAHSRTGTMQSSSTPGSGATVDDSASEAVSPVSKDDMKALRDSKDKERWTKLRKLRQVFHIKDGRRLSKIKPNVSLERPSTAG